MPMVKIMMTSGRMKAQKVLLQKEIARVVSDIADCPINAVQVVIDDRYELSEWSVGGQTWEEIVAHDQKIKIE